MSSEFSYVGDRSDGYLYIGTDGHGQVVLNHPDIDPDKDGYGHIIFSPDQARGLAVLLLRKAREAEAER